MHEITGVYILLLLKRDYDLIHRKDVINAYLFKTRNGLLPDTVLQPKMLVVCEILDFMPYRKVTWRKAGSASRDTLIIIIIIIIIIMVYSIESTLPI
jgi:hypothetical protein